MKFLLMYPQLSGGNDQPAGRPASPTRRKSGSIYGSCDTRIFVYPSRETHSIVARVARGVGNGTFTHHAAQLTNPFSRSPPRIGISRLHKSVRFERSLAYLDDRDEVPRQQYGEPLFPCQ